MKRFLKHLTQPMSGHVQLIDCFAGLRIREKHVSHNLPYRIVAGLQKQIGE
ncbi:hypothetical protein D3C73_1522890 [compost metagenome]